jgi:hypothetical protein
LCVEYVVHNLDAQGFAVQYLYPRSMVVSWEVIREREEENSFNKIARIQEASYRSVSSAIEASFGATTPPEAEAGTRYAQQHIQHLDRAPRAAPGPEGQEQGFERRFSDPQPDRQRPSYGRDGFRCISDLKPSGKVVLHF